MRRSRRILGAALIAMAAVAASGILIRAGIGPFVAWPSHISVNSPLALENLFWAPVFGLLVFGSGRIASDRRSASDQGGYPSLLRMSVIALGIGMAFASNLLDPFLSDDYVLISRATVSFADFLASLRQPGGDGAFRPLGTLYFSVVHMFVGYEALMWHLFSLSIHLINSVLVFIIARRLWRDNFSATVAAMLFGLHGTRPEVVAWTAGAFDLLACACVLISVLVSLKGDSICPPTWKCRVTLFFIVSAGVLFKESAYATPVILSGILFPVQSARKLRVILMIASGACISLFLYRWQLFGGPGGYIDSTTGRPQILSVESLQAVKALISRVWVIMLIPNNWDAGTSLLTVIALALLTAGLLAVVVLAGSDSHRLTLTRVGLIGATSCAVLPAIHLALIGASGLGSRVLYVPSIPFALLIGSLFRGTGRHGIAVAILTILGSLGVLEHNLAAWHRVAMKAQDLCFTAAREPNIAQHIVKPPGIEDGVFFFKNGFNECVCLVRDGHLRR